MNIFLYWRTGYRALLTHIEKYKSIGREEAMSLGMKLNTFYLPARVSSVSRRVRGNACTSKKFSLEERIENTFSVTRLNRVIRAFVLPSLPFPEVSTISRGWRRLSARIFRQNRAKSNLGGECLSYLYLFSCITGMRGRRGGRMNFIIKMSGFQNVMVMLSISANRSAFRVRYSSRSNWF